MENFDYKIKYFEKKNKIERNLNQFKYDGSLLKSYLYSLFFIETPHVKYYGSTRDFESRFLSHLSLLKNKKHQNRKLQNEFNLRGEKSLKYEIIKIVPFENLWEEEKNIIIKNRFKSYNKNIPHKKINLKINLSGNLA